jgi:hypothetical protein
VREPLEDLVAIAAVDVEGVAGRQALTLGRNVHLDGVGARARLIWIIQPRPTTLEAAIAAVCTG